MLKAGINTFKAVEFNIHFVRGCAGSEASQKPANIPLIPPPKQPTLPLHPAGQGTQASAAKPKSKKVCMIPCCVKCGQSIIIVFLFLQFPHWPTNSLQFPHWPTNSFHPSFFWTCENGWTCNCNFCYCLINPPFQFSQTAYSKKILTDHQH